MMPFVELWHPDSPGVRVIVRPGLLRRIRLNRSVFATLGECIRADRDRRLRGAR